MRVSLTIKVDVDAKAWATTYGIAEAEVREDVRTYAVEQLRGSAAAEEKLWEIQS